VLPAEQGEVLAALVRALVEGQKPLLNAYEELSRAAEKNWLLTSEVLGQLLGMTKSTITSKGATFRKIGYEFEKVKEGSATLWKVRQY
jgi:biotin operon repressor